MDLVKLKKKIKKLEASGTDAARLEKLKKKLKKHDAAPEEVVVSSKRPSAGMPCLLGAYVLHDGQSATHTVKPKC